MSSSNLKDDPATGAPATGAPVATSKATPVAKYPITSSSSTCADIIPMPVAALAAPPPAAAPEELSDDSDDENTPLAVWLRRLYDTNGLVHTIWPGESQAQAEAAAQARAEAIAAEGDAGVQFSAQLRQAAHEWDVERRRRKRRRIASVELSECLAMWRRIQNENQIETQ